MKLPHLLPLLALSTLALTSTVSCSRPRTPLGKILNAIKTGSPAEAEEARENGISVVLQEMPTIEKETDTICAALKDSNSYIRQQASAILKYILTTAPEHSGVVSACTNELLAAVNVDDVRMKQNVLFALGSNMSGPPSPLAHNAFLQAFGSSDYRVSQYGAIGLLREEDGNKESNFQLIETTLKNAPDSKVRLNLLYAIEGSKIVSGDLAQLSEKFVSDPDPQIQSAAIDAVCSASPDKASARSFLQNLNGSANLSPDSRHHAEDVLSQLRSRNSCPGPAILMF